MRKLLLTLSALLCAAALGAQMMPDSTVQVIAYWEVGDKMDYTLVEKVFDLDAEGAETLRTSASENIHFEVVAATDSTYTLQVRVDERSDQGPDAALEFVTSHLGAFLSGDAAFSSLLFFHGARLDQDRSYALELPYTQILGSGTATLENRFQVDRELTDDYSVVLRSETEADEKQLLPLVRNQAFALLQEREGLTDEDYNDFLDAFDEEIRTKPVKAYFGEYITEEIHLGTGWPLHWVFDRYVEFSQGKTYQGVHITREIVPEDKIGGE